MQSLRNKLSELALVLEESHCNIALLNEHWLLRDEIRLYIPQGYTLADSFCREGDPHGGSSIILSANISYDRIDISHLVHTGSLEASCTYINDFNVTLISLYRTPDSDCNLFFNQLESLLTFVKKNHC